MKERIRRIDPFLVGIALIAAFLNIYGIWKDQYANAYYTSAVSSMLQNFHNFFFASFDPGGFVTVDKPPVAFWVQTLFASIFGIHGWSVILPQALAGVGSVLLIYFLIRPSFNRTAARIAAMVMACTPIAAAVSRTNNVDGLLVFTLLLATWVLFKAIKAGTPIRFVVAFAIVGVAFNIKMLQAYMILPAFYLFYWLAYQEKLRKKLLILVVSTTVLLGVSFSWALVVDSIPAADRPYIGSSQTNSVLELAFGYNGISRLTGQKGLSGNIPGSGQRADGNKQGQVPSGAVPDNTGSVSSNGNGNWTEATHQGQIDGNSNTPPAGLRGGASGGRGQGGGGMFNTGTAGPLRLFQSELSGQISWLLPLAILSVLALLNGIRRRIPLLNRQKESLFWLAWLLPMMGFFSIAGFFHQYYLIMLAPAIAALAGAGWIAMSEAYHKRESWIKWLLPIGIFITTWFQFYILWPYRTQIGSVWGMGIGVIGSILAFYLFIALLRRQQPNKQERQVRAKGIRFMASGGIVILLIAPLYWAATPILYGGNSSLPEAGPISGHDGGNMFTQTGQAGENRTQPGVQGGVMQGTVNNQLLDYLETNSTGEKFLFATTNIGTAEAYIIETHKAVMAMGGFSGSDPILSVDKLKQMVDNYEIKYFLISGEGAGRGDSEVLNWIRENGKEISPSLWQSGATNSTTTENNTDIANKIGQGMDRAETLYEVSP